MQVCFSSWRSLPCWVWSWTELRCADTHTRPHAKPPGKFPGLKPVWHRGQTVHFQCHVTHVGPKRFVPLTSVVINAAVKCHDHREMTHFSIRFWSMQCESILRESYMIKFVVLPVGADIRWMSTPMMAFTKWRALDASITGAAIAAAAAPAEGFGVGLT